MDARSDSVYDVPSIKLPAGKKVKRSGKHPDPRGKRCRMQIDLLEIQVYGVVRGSPKRQRLLNKVKDQRIAKHDLRRRGRPRYWLRKRQRKS